MADYLPDDLILNIFSLIESQSSRNALSSVCKRWRALERLSRTTLCINHRCTDLDLKLRLARCFPNVKSIGFFARGPCIDSLSDDMLIALPGGFPKLEKLGLDSCNNISSLGLSSFAKICLCLKSLHLQNLGVGDDGLAVVGKSCKQLEDLNLTSCAGLTDYGLADLVLSCGKSLKSLRVLGCVNVTDASFEVVGSHCKSLETLSLGSNPISNTAVLVVAQGCPLIKVLELNATPVTDDGLIAVGTHCLSLETLSLWSTELPTDKSFCAIGNGCRKLKSLSLRGTRFLTDKGLEAIAAGCKEFTYLYVDNCPNVGTMGLESIARSCQHLTDLQLINCPSVDNHTIVEVGKCCKFLTTLHLNSCSGIGDDAIWSIASGI